MKPGSTLSSLICRLGAFLATPGGLQTRPAPVPVPIEIRQSAPVRVPVRRPSA